MLASLALLLAHLFTFATCHANVRSCRLGSGRRGRLRSKRFGCDAAVLPFGRGKLAVLAERPTSAHFERKIGELLMSAVTKWLQYTEKNIETYFTVSN